MAATIEGAAAFALASLTEVKSKPVLGSIYSSHGLHATIPSCSSLAASGLMGLGASLDLCTSQLPKQTTAILLHIANVAQPSAVPLPRTVHGGHGERRQGRWRSGWLSQAVVRGMDGGAGAKALLPCKPPGKRRRPNLQLRDAQILIHASRLRAGHFCPGLDSRLNVYGFGDGKCHMPRASLATHIDVRCCPVRAAACRPGAWICDQLSKCFWPRECSMALLETSNIFLSLPKECVRRYWLNCVAPDVLTRAACL